MYLHRLMNEIDFFKIAEEGHSTLTHMDVHMCVCVDIYACVCVYVCVRVCACVCVWL